MLINFSDIVSKYKLKIRGIIHIGAHLAEELNEYSKNNVKEIIWVEANPNIFNKLITIANKDKCYNTAIYSVDNLKLDFNITNNGESSSLLELDMHKIEHPHIHVTEIIQVNTKRFDTLITENNLSIDNYNFVNLDIQGAELHALKGFGDFLNKIEYIYTEINIKPLYKECVLIDELDNFLNSKGFSRVETCWTTHGWGDALYIRK